MSDITYVSIAEHTEFAKRMDAVNENLDKRVSSLEVAVKDIAKIAQSVEKLATNMENMVKEQERVSDRLQAIEEKPAKRWDAVVSGIISGVIGILIGLLSAGIIK